MAGIFRISNELAPKPENELSTELCIPSMAVNIPTNAVIPKEIMSAVKIVLSQFHFIDLSNSNTFSLRFMLDAVQLNFSLQFISLFTA